MFKINLQFNNAYKWNLYKNVYSKGYFFDKKDNLFKGINMSKYFYSKSIKIINSNMNLINGCFAIVIQRNKTLIIYVDRLRSIPLFYCLQNGIFYLSDNAYWIKDKANLKKPNNILKNEFLLTGYVTGRDTLFSEIKQVRSGEYIIIKEKDGKIDINTKKYFYFLHKDFFNERKEELFNKLDNLSEKIITRLIKSVNGNTIVIPLSGGYDSRYIASMLKKLHYEKVICFSYGKKNNFEASVSKKVADKLGYRWYFVEYNTKKWLQCLNSKEIKKYWKYGGNLCSLAHYQDWPAVGELIKEKLIPKNSVFVPGHSGDMLGGSHIPDSLDFSKLNYKFEDIAKYLFHKHYLLSKLPKDVKMNTFLGRIKEELKEFDISDVESYINLSDYWNFQNRQSKYIVNSVLVYEFYGYEWRIPLWDYEFMDFWLRVPLDYRINKVLYDEYLFKRLFNDYNILFKHSYKNINLDKLKKDIMRISPRYITKFFTGREYTLNVWEAVKIYLRENEIKISSYPQATSGLLSNLYITKYINQFTNI